MLYIYIYIYGLQGEVNIYLLIVCFPFLAILVWTESKNSSKTTLIISALLEDMC